MLFTFSRRVVLFASLRKMATCAPISVAVLDRIQKKSLEAEQLAELLRAQINSLQQTAVAKACKVQEEKLRAENAVLRGEVEKLKSRLVELEIRNGVKQVPMPKPGATVKAAASVTTTAQATSSATAAVKPAVTVDKENLSTENVKKATKPAVAKVTEGPAEPITAESKKPEQGGKKQPASTEGGKKQPAKADGGKGGAAVSPGGGAVTTGGGTAAGGEGVDASRLNMRIGFIVSAKRHPDADALYVEEVDVGEGKPRTIVSGLVKHVSLEQMQQRYAVFLLNLKPAKMRGILSEGMIMCASTPDKVEIIQPPEGVTAGQRVVVDNYPGAADDQLNPKKKIWEQIQPDLRINPQGAATYKGSLWRIEGQPETSFKAPSLIDCPIK